MPAPDGGRAAGPAVAETHTSVVFFVGERAYKLKKPVVFPFIDLSTRERRLENCRREVELNRRLAPDVYLGVLDVLSDGRPVDHLVEMVRMPSDRRLSTLVRAGADVGGCLRQLARVVAAFHQEARVSPEISQAGTDDQVRDHWSRNLAELRRFVGAILDADTYAAVSRLAARYLDGRHALFVRRIARRMIRDGHGDLLADDVFCLDDGPRILDCIEFDDALRWGDVLADVAFLAMDLERLGRPDLADRFVGDYAAFSGERHPPSLADHYIAYRALVRCKVACLRHEQGAADAAEDARTLLAIARRHLERGAVRLLLVGGPPGTGKSTLAEGLSRTTGWTVVRSDETRKDLLGLGHTEHAEAAAYGASVTDRTYDALLARAAQLLEHGWSVILDASWSTARHRRAAADLARATSSDLSQLRCALPARTAGARIGRRRRAGGDPSDADAGVAERMAAAFEAWPDAVVIASDGSVDETLRRARSALGLGGP